MSKNNEISSNELKALLAEKVGGEEKDWKRLSKKTVIWGDVEREFENKTLGVRVTLSERPDGLIHAQLPDGSMLTARYSAAEKFNAAAQPSAIDRVMNLILEDADEIDDALYAAAVKEGLARRFSFTVHQYDMDGDEPTTFAEIYPTVRDATFKCPAYIRPLVPGAQGIDECMTTEWHFPTTLDTPAKIAAHLQALGFVWDEEAQKRDKEVRWQIETAVRSVPAVRPGVAVETDPRKNAVADRIIAMLMGDEDPAEEDSDDVSYGVPLSMVREAGVALANRYCFAIQTDDDGSLRAMITPSRFFEENGCCDDQDGPIWDLLPPRVGNAMEATWEFYDERIKTPLDAARELQKYGFVWNKDFQEFIDGDSDVKAMPLLRELENASAEKPSVPKSKSPRR